MTLKVLTNLKTIASQTSRPACSAFVCEQAGSKVSTLSSFVLSLPADDTSNYTTTLCDLNKLIGYKHIKHQLQCSKISAVPLLQSVILQKILNEWEYSVLNEQHHLGVETKNKGHLAVPKRVIFRKSSKGKGTIIQGFKQGFCNLSF